MKAKEFILSESKAYRDAVDNGYDIRMDEKEILYWMERYAEYKAENLPISPVVGQSEQLVCDHPEDEQTWMRSGKASYCNKCAEMVKAN